MLPKNNDRQAKETIKLCKLNRDRLVEGRNAYINQIKKAIAERIQYYHTQHDVLIGHLKQLKRDILREAEEEKEWSAFKQAVAKSFMKLVKEVNNGK